MNRVIFIRHGETEFNKQGISIGHIDDPLNHNGTEQAKELREKLQDLEVDYVFSSPLARASGTASIAFPNKEIIIDERLIERYLGNFQNGPKKNIDWNFYDDFNLNSNFNDVEPLQSVFQRNLDFLLWLSDNFENKTICVFTHGGCLRSIFACLEGFPENGLFYYMEPKHTQYYEYTFDRELIINNIKKGKIK